MFGVNAYIKIWNVTDKGKYTEVECSTSKKNKLTGNYETDFSSKYVRFIGDAHNRAPKSGEKVKITNCGVQNVYEKDGKKEYMKNPTYLVFDFERTDNSTYIPSAYGGGTDGFTEVPLPEDGLPF